MKLLSAFIVSAFAAKEDCPSVAFPSNKGWSWNDETSQCEPVGVDVTCTGESMTVEFGFDHIFAELLPAYQNTNTSAAYPGSCDTQLENSVDGRYTVTFGLDDCGTEISHDGDKIVFKNDIKGSPAALKSGDIYITSPLTLPVTCEYSDSIDVMVSNVGIAQHEYQMAEEVEQGEFKPEFTLSAFSDSAMTRAINATNRVIIGEPVYSKLSVKEGFTDRLEYIITDCIASLTEEPKETDPKFPIIQERCFSNLIEAQGDLSGNSGEAATMQFNGFTFNSADESLYIKCRLELCVTEVDPMSEDGSRVIKDPDCGIKDNTCDFNPTSYSPAAALPYSSP